MGIREGEITTGWCFLSLPRGEGWLVDEWGLSVVKGKQKREDVKIGQGVCGYPCIFKAVG